MVIGNKLIIYINKLNNLNVLHDFFVFFRDISHDIKYNHFLITKHVENFDSFSDVNIINNLNPDFIKECDENKITKNCPIFPHSKEEFLPYLLEVRGSKYLKNGKSHRFSGKVFENFGMARNICYPVCDHEGRRGGVSFSGGESFLVDHDLYSLHLICQYAYQRMSLATSQKLLPKPRLSKREIECLNWTAAGKTSSETAAILQLSDHTVTHYLTSAGRKLNATNRVQAVAKAIRLGLLPKSDS